MHGLLESLNLSQLFNGSLLYWTKERKKGLCERSPAAFLQLVTWLILFQTALRGRYSQSRLLPADISLGSQIYLAAAH